MGVLWAQTLAGSLKSQPTDLSAYETVLSQPGAGISIRRLADGREKGFCAAGFGKNDALMCGVAARPSVPACPTFRMRSICPDCQTGAPISPEMPESAKRKACPRLRNTR
jgi:hypothetical protein